MRFLIVRTDVRAAAYDEVAAAMKAGNRVRDEKLAPEARRQIVHADDRDAALILARALSNVGSVRSGRQRVKVLPLAEPERFPGSPARMSQQFYPYRPTGSPPVRA
jgi:hypothetical protein